MGLIWTATAQKTEISFHVVFKDENIGKLHAVEERSETKSHKDLRTETDASIFAMSIHVESEVKTAHDNGILIEGTSYQHANRGAEDIHGHVTTIGDKHYQAIRNGNTRQIKGQHISFCVIDLYFNEPIGISHVFSNMYTDFVSIKSIDQGKYQLTTPDEKESFFTYRNGKLMSVETKTPLGKVVVTRVVGN